MLTAAVCYLLGSHVTRGLNGGCQARAGLNYPLTQETSRTPQLRMPAPRGILFGGFDVSKQVFYLTSKTYAIVNLRPLLPGHVLVCPVRHVERFSQLSPEETSDLFLTVRSVSKVVEKVYGADALNIAVQDGPLAGQSISHVHCHIIPRRLRDLPDVDYIYELLGKNNIQEAYAQMRERAALGVDNDSRKDRTEDDMANEAQRLREYIISSTDPNI